MTDRVYRALLADAREALHTGRSVVVDASFSRADQRTPFLELADTVGAPAIVVETVAPEATIRERMAARSLDLGEVSDADFGVYLRMRDEYEPPEEVSASARLRVEPGEADEKLTASAIDLLVGQTRFGLG
jgi:hypothetical protein